VEDHETHLREETWSLQLFGGLSCHVGRRSFTHFGSRKAALLLIRLGLNGTEPIQRDEIALALWPDEPADVSRPRLRQALVSLKSSFPESERAPFVASKNELRLDGEVSVDCWEFEGLVTSNRDEEAIAAYRPLLPGWNEPWLASFRERYEELFVEAVNRVVGRSDDERAVPLLSKAHALHPFNEVLLAELMTRLMNGGQQVRAVKAYEAYVAMLESQMKIGPGDALRALAEEAAQSKAPFEAARIRLAPAPLPNPITRMFGREPVIERIQDLVAANRRLITLTGIGGIGKTRVALEYAHREHRIDVVAFASLVEATDAEGVYEILQTALGVPYGYGQNPREVVFRALSNRKALIVLDNLEHLMPKASGLVQGLLSSCPLISVLATSRVPLAIQGEQVLPIGPLESADDAAAMFLDRAALISNALVDGADSVAHVAKRIAADLDGIPLAIELAAAQAGLFSLPEIESRLKDRLSFRETSVQDFETRHARLGSVMDWSIESLSEEARNVLCMLSVFHGTFTLESAAVVFGKPVERAVEVLRRRALVIETPGVELRRFRVLETVRDAASVRLDSDDQRKYRGALRRYLVDFSDRQQPLLKSSETAARANLVLAEEVENYRAALGSALEEDSELGLELTIRYSSIGGQKGQILGARRWLETYLLGRDWQPSRVLASAFFELAITVGFYGQDDLEVEYLRRAAAIAETAGAVHMQVLTETNLALHLLWTNRFTAARAAAERAMKNLSPQSSHLMICELVVVRARGLLGELEWAQERTKEILERRLRSGGDSWTLSEVWFGLSQLALEAENFELALSAAREGLGTLEQGGYESMASNMLSFLAGICVAAGRRGEAWELASRMDELGLNRGIAAGTLYGRFYSGLLLSSEDLLAEAAQHAIGLTQWIMAARAIDALAGLVSDRSFSRRLHQASAEILIDHDVELSVREAAAEANALAALGVPRIPVEPSAVDRSQSWMKLLNETLARRRQ